MPVSEGGPRVKSPALVFLQFAVAFRAIFVHPVGELVDPGGSDIGVR
jgi:hypothetical protein